MINLLFHNKKDIKELPDVVEAVEIMQDFEQFNSIDEVKKVDNIHIQNAIKELESKNNLHYLTKSTIKAKYK